MDTPAQEEAEVLLRTAHPGRGKESSVRLGELLDVARSRGISEETLEQQLESWVVQFPRRRHQWFSADAALADLRALLLGPESTSGRTWRRLRRIAEWIIEHYIVVASVVTALATVFYGLAYARFYEALDVTPEDAGISPTEILTRSALGGVALTLLVSLGIFCFFAPLVALREDSTPKEEPGTWWSVVGNLVVTLLAISVIYLLLSQIGFQLNELPYLAFLPICFFLGVSLKLRRRPKLKLGPRSLRISLDKYVVLYIAVIPLGLMLAGWAILTEARYYGNQASAGFAVRDPKIWGLPFLGVRAEPALISWKKGELPGADLPHCAVFLGGNGDDVFYDNRYHTTFHVPDGIATIQLRAEMTRC